jgi:hypothetical protein
MEAGWNKRKNSVLTNNMNDRPVIVPLFGIANSMHFVSYSGSGYQEGKMTKVIFKKDLFILFT